MKILVAGTCHAVILGRAIQIAGEISPADVDCRVLGAHSFRSDTVCALSEELLAFVASCDVFVSQIDHRGAEGFPDIVPRDALKISFPVFAMNWLWPFATQAHPKHLPEPASLMSVPFPRGHGDALLYRLLSEHACPQDAFDAFVRLDPTEHTNIDRVFELTKERILSIEQNTDIRVWHLIENGFRRHRLFWSSEHPTWQLFEPVFREILRRLPLDLRASQLDAITSRLGRSRPWAELQAPIHPRIAEYFGLEWHHPDMRYQQGIAG